MHSGFFHDCLLIALAVALIVAASTDIRRRQIDNWLNATIALGAPLFWWASGMALWPDVAIQFGLAAGTFIVLASLFAFGAMGGGDVKLLTVLALWIRPEMFLNLVLIMALAGGLLTILMGSWHIARRQREKLAIPYGVAIAFAGLFVLGTHYLPASVAAGGISG